jgi:hypothetical protein
VQQGKPKQTRQTRSTRETGAAINCAPRSLANIPADADALKKTRNDGQ